MYNGKLPTKEEEEETNRLVQRYQECLDDATADFQKSKTKSFQQCIRDRINSAF